jgi:two-component system sensor histidine kinase ChvG
MRPPRRPRRRRILSPLTRRILFLNLIGPALLGIGFLYLDDYRSGLIDAQLAALRMQARIVATAVSETARPDDDGEAGLDYRLAPEILRPVLFRLMQPADGHARIFAPEGHVLADSRIVSPYGGRVLVEPLPPPRAPPSWPMRLADDLYDRIVALVPARAPLSVWPDAPEPRAEDFAEVAAALAGETSSALRSYAGGAGMLITVAAPVQRFKQVMGAVMLIASGEQIEASVRALRYDIVKLCFAAMLVTALASLYIARTITLPILRLAAATERVRRSRAIGGRRGAASAQAAIPDMRARRDEIGDLSGALVEMTAALSQRIDEIERFAADVAHEIKNPLTSLKSAVETAARVADPARREKLMQIIVEDVQRIDRLLGDISGASRLDAELGRAAGESVDIARLLETLAEIHGATARPSDPRVVLAIRDAAALRVTGVEDRLGQVLRNLIANALSFSPPDGRIVLAARRDGDSVEIAVEDEGPGIPSDRLERIFDRFYSARPAGEKFGTHSGLGLSISRQIVAAHGGSISAANVARPDGSVGGARFVIRLPRE